MSESVFTPPERPRLPDDVAAQVLRHGRADLLGRMPWSSNATFLVNLSCDGAELLAVYKPQRGERPLWDFPRGTLCARELAAFDVSAELGWDLVPDTVLRDGPAGVGMMQRFVDHDPQEHYFTLLEQHPETFRKFAAFDIVINNTDRKGGHCLRDTDGRIWSVDHGVSFHAQWKLRTVIWDFAGEPLPGDVRDDLARLAAALRSEKCARLLETLDRFEVDAVRARTEALVEEDTFPDADPGYHSFPWPLI